MRVCVCVCACVRLRACVCLHICSLQIVSERSDKKNMRIQVYMLECVPYKRKRNANDLETAISRHEASHPSTDREQEAPTTLYAPQEAARCE